MDRDIRFFPTQGDFEAWLEENHAQEGGIWLRISKKGADQASVTYAEALDVALCFGWIDGQKASLDEKSWLQYFTRRKKKSLWSQINREHVGRLTAEGRMRPPGLAAVQAAQASGEWEAAYPPTSRREIPDDFRLALEGNPRAQEFFASLGSQNRFAFVFRIHSAKKPETRQKRIREFVLMLENHQVFFPPKAKNQDG